MDTNFAIETTDVWAWHVIVEGVNFLDVNVGRYSFNLKFSNNLE